MVKIKKYLYLCKSKVLLVIILFLFLFSFKETVAFTIQKCREILSTVFNKEEKLQYQKKEALTIQNTQNLINALDEYFSSFNQLTGINGVLLVSSQSETFVKAYNHPKTPKGQTLSEDSVFRIGSISKQFTAASILYLEQERKLSLEEKMCQYILDCPDDKKNIKISQLLSHTSGLRANAFSNFLHSVVYPFYSVLHFYLFGIEDRQKSLNRMKKWILKKALRHAPSEEYLYSNSGYFLLAVIIENISEKFYGDFLRDAILSKLGIESTGSFLDSQPTRTPVDDIPVKGFPPVYGSVISHEILTTALMKSLSYTYGAGDLYSTVFDLRRWNEALYETGEILNQKQLEKMTQSYLKNYGFGIVIELTEKSKTKIYWHNGLFMYSFSVNFYFPEKKLSVIFFSNNFSNDKNARIFHENLIHLLTEKEYKSPKSREN